MRVLTDEGRKALDAHLNEEKTAMAAGDRQRLTYLMGDFHIRIAELSGNAIIVDILRDLGLTDIGQLARADLFGGRALGNIAGRHEAWADRAAGAGEPQAGFIETREIAAVALARAGAL